MTQTPQDNQKQREGAGGRWQPARRDWVYREDAEAPILCDEGDWEGVGKVKCVHASAHGTYPSFNKICSISSVGQAPWWVGTELSV